MSQTSFDLLGWGPVHVAPSTITHWGTSILPQKTVLCGFRRMHSSTSSVTQIANLRDSRRRDGDGLKPGWAHLITCLMPLCSILGSAWGSVEWTCGDFGGLLAVLGGYWWSLGGSLGMSWWRLGGVFESPI
jgi:hypothetical protein